MRVVPGVAAQFTDGPKDSLEATEQSQLVIAAAAGGPQQPSERDQFARTALNGLPPMKDVRISSSESMRIGGQAGHEVRALGKDAQTGAEIEIVQWLRFGTGAYLRILGLAPKEQWAAAFTRFRAVRDRVWSRASGEGDYCPPGLSLAGGAAAAAGADLAPPFDTATSAGRNTRSPIR